MAVDLAIIGGGAAGLFAGISAANIVQQREGRAKIAVLDRMPRVGKKLLATGNGRCNLTNLQLRAQQYHGADPAFVDAVLSTFPPIKTMEAFAALGVPCREEAQGRVYPYCGQASAVLDALRAELGRLGVEEYCAFPVTQIRKIAGGFLITSPAGEVRARAVLVAAGGQASPALGSDGSGYALLRKLGHTIVPCFPALAPLRAEGTKALKGLRAACTVSLLAEGRLLRKEAGELQFTEQGLSGICIFNLSRLAGQYFSSPGSSEKLTIEADFAPDWTESALLEYLGQLAKSRPELPLELLPAGLLGKRLGQRVLKDAGFHALNLPAAALEGRALQKLVRSIKRFSFPVTGCMPWNTAQVTAGGVSCREVDPRTMASRRVEGLFLAGEILDVDGDCGGCNLQWAWSSAALAGSSAANYLLSRRNPFA